MEIILINKPVIIVIVLTIIVAALLLLSGNFLREEPVRTAAPSASPSEEGHTYEELNKQMDQMIEENKKQQ